MIPTEHAHKMVDDLAVESARWDVETTGGPATTAAIAKAHELIDRFPRSIQGVYGSYTIEWGGSPSLSVEIDDDGRLGYLFMVKTYSERWRATDDEIAVLIERFVMPPPDGRRDRGRMSG